MPSFEHYFEKVAFSPSLSKKIIVAKLLSYRLTSKRYIFPVKQVPKICRNTIREKGAEMQNKVLDEIDRKILAMLRENGRSKFVELSRSIGFTSMGVKKRVSKLIERNIVNVSAMLNLSILKIQPALIKVSLDANFSRAFIEHFENCPKVISSFSRRNEVSKVIMFVFGESKGALEGLLNTVKSRSGVLEAELEVLGELNYTPYLPIRMEKMLQQSPPCHADCASCNYYQKNDCPGCPVSPVYRGSI